MARFYCVATAMLLLFISFVQDVQVTKTYKKTFPVLFFKTTKSGTEKSGKQLFPLLQPQQGTVNCETECSEDDGGLLDIFDIFSAGDDKCTVDCKFTYSGGTTSIVKEEDNDEKKIEAAIKKLKEELKIEEAIKKLKEELKIEQEKNKIEEDKKKVEEKEIAEKIRKSEEEKQMFRENVKGIKTLLQMTNKKLENEIITNIAKENLMFDVHVKDIKKLIQMIDNKLENSKNK